VTCYCCKCTVSHRFGVGHQCRGNLRYVPALAGGGSASSTTSTSNSRSRLVYPAATVAVVHDPASHSQSFYQGHTGEQASTYMLQHTFRVASCDIVQCCCCGCFHMLFSMFRWCKASSYAVHQSTCTVVTHCGSSPSKPALTTLQCALTRIQRSESYTSVNTIAT
jgi:hypothetical protein